MDSLARPFRQLEPAARTEALVALVHELTPHEWRHMQGLLNAKTFQFDIVGRLPFELVLAIFSHLDITAPCRLQLVSKRWHQILSSPALLDQKLREWYPNARFDKDLRLRKAEQIHRFSTGRPYTSLVVEFEAYLIEPVFVDDTFAWIADDDRSVGICNLRSGNTIRVQTPGRARIAQIALSEDLIAFATYTTCHVMNISNGLRKQFRLPNAKIFSLACSGRFVVCVFSPERDNEAQVGMYIWDFDRSLGQSFPAQLEFDIGRSQGAHFWSGALLPDAVSKTVAIFYNPQPWNSDHSKGCHIYCTRYTFKGEYIGVTKNFFPGLGQNFLRRCHPVDSRGRMALEFCQAGMDTPDQSTVCLDYDGNTHQFLAPQTPGNSNDPLLSLRHAVHWNNAYYQLVVEEVRLDDHDYDKAHCVCLGTRDNPMFKGVDGSIERHKTRPLGYTNQVPRRGHYDPESGRIFANDTFVIALVNVDGESHYLQICCFEKDLTLPVNELHDMLDVDPTRDSDTE